MAETVVQNIITTLAETEVTDTDSSPESTSISMVSNLISDASIMAIALMVVFAGAKLATRLHTLSVQNDEVFGDELSGPITNNWATVLLLIASVDALIFYTAHKVLSEESMDILLSALTFVGILGEIIVSSFLFGSELEVLLPNIIPQNKYLLLIESDQINIGFTLYQAINVVLSAIFTNYYLYYKNWIGNNLFAATIYIYIIEHIQINNVKTGCIALCGLFVYDIFWAFYTDNDVMDTMILNSFETCIPVLLVFPRDLMKIDNSDTKKFSTLALVNIIVPGIFTALLLRFDQSLQRKRNVYFNASFFGYFLGLLITLFTKYVFEVAQSALLYLAPACLIAPILVALISGDLRALFSFEDETYYDEELIYDSSSEDFKSD